MNNTNNTEKIKNALKNSGPEGARALNALENGKLNDFINDLPKKDADKLKALLSDKGAVEMLLNSEQGKRVINNLFGGKNNG